VALAVLLIALATPLVAIDARATTDPLTITAHVGYGDVVKVQQWMPVSIAITNNGPEVDGTLDVLTAFNGRIGPSLSYVNESRLVIAPGATKYFRVYVVEEAPGATVTVQIVKNGRIMATQDAAAVNTAATLIGVLSDSSTAFDDFAVVHPGRLSATVVHLGVPDVPDSAIELRAFDLLAIDDFATEGLSPSQRSAITDFVQTGGSLLVGTGASWRRTLAGLPSSLLPLQVDGLTTLASSRTLGGLGGVQVATGALTGGTAWLSDGDQPLLTEKVIGSGSVTLATFDWKQDPFAGWSGSEPLLRQVLVRTVYGSQAQRGSIVNLGGPFGGPFGGSGASLYQKSNALSRALNSLPALDLPSLALTGAIVLIYVLLVGPINFFILRALHRRALAWVTLPVIAVVVAGVAYGGGIWTKGQSVQTNQISVIHLQPGVDRAYSESYTGVLTPTRGDYEASIARPALVSPIGSYNGFTVPGRADIRVNAGAGTVALPGMTAFTLRGFATEGMTTGPRLSGHLRLANGQLTGTIENLSSTSFSDLVVIAGDGFQKLGPLAPGASATVELEPKVSNFNGPPAIYSIYSNYSFGPAPQQPTSTQREGDTKTAILSVVQSGGSFKGVPSAVVVPMVVAWIPQPFQAVTVNGAHPRAHGETAVALTLPVDEIGPGNLPRGVVSGRIVDLDGDIQQGPPGALIVQNGTVTYQFAPRLAPGAHLTNAAISVSNTFFGKGPQGGQGTVTPTRGEAWDWSRSAWVDIAYQENTATSLPTEVVNPATGEVRVRIIVGTNGFLAAGASLVGSVD
jgi:hypothetical protein